MPDMKVEATHGDQVCFSTTTRSVLRPRGPRLAGGGVAGGGVAVDSGGGGGEWRRRWRRVATEVAKVARECIDIFLVECSRIKCWRRLMLAVGAVQQFWYMVLAHESGRQIVGGNGRCGACE